MMTVTISIFIVIIIFIPSIIVNMPKFKTSGQISEHNEEIIESIEVNQMDSPQIEVSVKRMNTGEIEKIPLELYVASVVASEMPAEFENEALKAQAIAARTYIVNHLFRKNSNEEIITDTTQHQVYRNEKELKSILGSNFQWKWDKINDAVAATANMILTFNDEPITPTFFSMSNGFTEDAKHYWGNELPYLKSVESKWEEELPNFIEQKIVSINDLQKKLSINLQHGTAIPISIKHTPSNRVSEVTINNETFTGRDIREKLDLRSNDFQIQQKNDHFIFTTKGYGHGVGMSQYGANGMAKEGKSFEEILTYYYQDVQIETIVEATPSLVAK